MASNKLWSLAGVILIGAAAVTPLKGELASLVQADPQEAYLTCLSSELKAADPTTGVRRMVPAYQNCATKEAAYRSYLLDQGVRTDRMKWLVGKVNETVYARYVGTTIERLRGCFERQMKKADAQLIS